MKFEIHEEEARQFKKVTGVKYEAILASAYAYKKGHTDARGMLFFLRDKVSEIILHCAISGFIELGFNGIEHVLKPIVEDIPDDFEFDPTKKFIEQLKINIYTE